MTDYSGAVCRQIPIDLADQMFYSNEMGRYRHDENMALRLCSTCPVERECLIDALNEEINERWIFGVRGGFTAYRRKQMLNQIRNAK